MKLLIDPDGYNYSEDLLQKIKLFLKKEKIGLSEITAIEVINRPIFSFTALRVACAVGNALAYSLKVKINGKKAIMPNYGREANITLAPRHSAGLSKKA